jgi:membrane fusion protein, multidrug efflux system
MQGEKDRRLQSDTAENDSKKDKVAEPAAAAATHGSLAMPLEHSAASVPASDPSAAASATAPKRPESRPYHALRKWLLLAAVVVGLCAAGYFVVLPWTRTALNTVSTDDAYVNSHVTFVAPRVAGQVSTVLVDDNYYVKKGETVVELDSEPFRVQVAIKKAAVDSAESDLTAAQAQVRSQVAQARANRYKLEHAIESVDNQIANLRASVASLNSRKATLELAKANLKRGEELAPKGAFSWEELDLRREAEKVSEAGVEQALEAVYAIRVSLGLPAQPASGHGLAEVPPDLDQTFSAVRQALSDLLQSAAAFGYAPNSWTTTPKETLANFYKQDPQGDLNRILARLIPQAPAIKQAEAKLRQSQRDLDEAELNLRYCTIVSEIDGVVTSRNVNPGNNVQVGRA